MPEPWDFDIAFEETTGHVTRVVQGDNSRFEAYLHAQNTATDTSRAAVEKQRRRHDDDRGQQQREEEALVHRLRP